MGPDVENERTTKPDSAASALTGGLGDDDSWEANAQYMLERCPYTVWQRPGGGLVDLKATLVVTFQGMQMRLDGHPMFVTPKVSMSACPHGVPHRWPCEQCEAPNA